MTVQLVPEGKPDSVKVRECVCSLGERSKACAYATVRLAEFEDTMKDDEINSKAKTVATIAQELFGIPIFHL